MPRSLLAACLFACAACAQTPPAFDISTVRVSPRADWVKNPASAMQGGYLIGDRYEVHRATMLDLIHLAYNVDADKIYGGPSWLDYDKFEVVAKTKPGTKPDALRLMLQALLAERFQLSVKQDTQPLPAYVLSAKDQSKLKAAEGASAEGCQNVPVVRTGPNVTPQSEIRCKSVTMDEFANGLTHLAPQYIQRFPVVNSTGIEGSFDIDLKYPARIMRITDSGGIETENGNGLFDAIDKQLGLKLELGKAPQAVLTVADVKEQPTPDPSGVDAALPPLPPPQFEVAALRPCDSSGPLTAAGVAAIVAPKIEPGGRVTASCYPLTALLSLALNFPGNLQDIPGLPKSLQSGPLQNRVTINARAPAAVTPNETVDLTQSRDILAPMLTALFVDRYKLKYHYEDRPMDALTLVASKPKLTRADPAGRTGCKRADQSTAASTKIVCNNITLAQFAEQILGLYPAARFPVIDGTHLDGAWDFSIEFNQLAGLLQQLRTQVAAQGGGAPGNADVADPSGPTTLAEAIEKQLGLKLETHKRSVPVLVIDHMEDMPTEN